MQSSIAMFKANASFLPYITLAVGKEFTILDSILGIVNKHCPFTMNL